MLFLSKLCQKLIKGQISESGFSNLIKSPYFKSRNRQKPFFHINLGQMNNSQTVKQARSFSFPYYNTVESKYMNNFDSMILEVTIHRSNCECYKFFFFL